MTAGEAYKISSAQIDDTHVECAQVFTLHEIDMYNRGVGFIFISLEEPDGLY